MCSEKNIEECKVINCLEVLQPILFTNTNVDHKKTITVVLQRELGLRNYDSDVDVMLTFGVGPCVAVIIVGTERCCVCHIDAFTNVWSLYHTLKQIQSEGSIQIHIATGHGMNNIVPKFLML